MVTSPWFVARNKHFKPITLGPQTNPPVCAVGTMKRSRPRITNTTIRLITNHIGLGGVGPLRLLDEERGPLDEASRRSPAWALVKRARRKNVMI